MKEAKFDVLAAVLFHEDYRVRRAALIPHAIVMERAVYTERTESSKFILRDSIWSLPGVTDVTDDLRRAEQEWPSPSKL